MVEAVTTARPLCAGMRFETTGNKARLAQSAERKALNLVVVGSSPTVGVLSINYNVIVWRAKVWRRTCGGGQNGHTGI